MKIIISIFLFISISMFFYCLLDIICKLKFSNFKKQGFILLFWKILKPIMNISIVKKYYDKIQPDIKLLNNENVNFEKLFTIQILLSICGLLFGIVVIEQFLLTFVSGVLFFFAPLIWLKSEINKKNKNIFRALPDTLDLLTLCMKAGLDFNAALNKYIEKGEKNTLHYELSLMQKEIQMGKSRIDALNSLVERTKHPELNDVVNSIIQGLKLGTSLAPILNSLSEQLRTKRFQLAEKLAHEAPTKMLFPLIFFIFPTIFVILFGPIILSFLKG